MDGRCAFTKVCLHLQKQIAAWFPQLDKAGWFIPKLHEIQHFPRDTARFGTPRNYDSGPCEHNHIFDAKRPGRRAQKNPRTFLPQVARRVYHGLCINNLQHMMQQVSPVATADTRKPPPMSVGRTRYTVDLTMDPVVPPISIKGAEYNPVFLRWLRDTYGEDTESVQCYSLCIKKVTLCCGRRISRLWTTIEAMNTPFKTRLKHQPIYVDIVFSLLAL